MALFLCPCFLLKSIEDNIMSTSSTLKTSGSEGRKTIGAQSFADRALERVRGKQQRKTIGAQGDQDVRKIGAEGEQTRKNMSAESDQEDRRARRQNRYARGLAGTF